MKESQRKIVVERLAGHMLEHGLARNSLRQLAAAAGLSDRMLLYYFSDKADIVWQSLTYITDGFISALDGAIPAERMTADALQAQALHLMRSPSVRPSMRLWLEIVVAAARNETPFPALAASTLARFLGWMEQRLDIENQQERQETAALLLATIDGVALFDLLGRHDLASHAQRRIDSAHA